MLKNWNYLFRTVVYAGVVGLLGYGGYEVRHAWTSLRAKDEALIAKDRQIADLSTDLAAKAREIERLQTALQLLKVDHRLARIEVLAQAPLASDPGKLATTLRFTEITPDSKPLRPPQEMTILGNLAYVDALVIKFEDRYVEQGDQLRGTSVCLFRRLFGEYQQPHEGHPLDAVGARPTAYSPGDEPSAYERDLWARFWDYANDADKAARAGVRAIHGEAPSIQLRPGKTYDIDLRSSGGLSIRPSSPSPAGKPSG